MLKIDDLPDNQGKCVIEVTVAQSNPSRCAMIWKSNCYLIFAFGSELLGRVHTKSSYFGKMAIDGNQS
jgi:hypothetical protein